MTVTITWLHVEAVIVALWIAVTGWMWWTNRQERKNGYWPSSPAGYAVGVAFGAMDAAIGCAIHAAFFIVALIVALVHFVLAYYHLA